MAYCTRSDFDIPARKLIQLCDDEALAVGETVLADAESTNPAITARIDKALDRAHSKIDTYLRARYSVPLATVPETINRIAVDLTLYYLHGRRDSEYDIPASITQRYREALAELEEINAARLDLGVEPPPGSSSKVQVVGTQAEQLFTDDTLADF
jgi:phage gp36-like protein